MTMTTNNSNKRKMATSGSWMKLMSLGLLTMTTIVQHPSSFFIMATAESHVDHVYDYDSMTVMIPKATAPHNPASAAIQLQQALFVGGANNSTTDGSNFRSGNEDSSSDSSGSSSGGDSVPQKELYGWVAALLAMLAFGTFGVPIKSKTARSLDIDPLVMQTYKTTMFFITSWIFVIVRQDEIAFTPWGIVSGLFWVPGGVATIYAIKNAGLAIGIGVGASFIVLVSFYWGIVVFGEHVHSRPQACSAVGCMLCGLAGMAYYSSPTVAHTTNSAADTNAPSSGEVNAASSHQDDDDVDGGTHRQGNGFLAGLLSGNLGGSGSDTYYDHVRRDDPDFLPPDVDDDQYVSFRDIRNGNINNVTAAPTTNYVAMNNDEDVESSNDIARHDRGNNTNPSDDTNREHDDDDDVFIRRQNLQYCLDLSTRSESSTISPSRNVRCCFGKVSIRRRTLGILVAVFSGVYGGSLMAPLKYAPPDCKGLGYLISFAVGASIVTLTLWIIRFLFLCFGRYEGSVKDAYNALPSFHFRKMWPYGGACGLMWSIGNFFSILSVENLGEGVGYSVTQASILVSGLWGIFYFREIEGTAAISKWMLSALVTVTGILLLSFEHHQK